MTQDQSFSNSPAPKKEPRCPGCGEKIIGCECHLFNPPMPMDALDLLNKPYYLGQPVLLAFGNDNQPATLTSMRVDDDGKLHFGYSYNHIVERKAPIQETEA